MNVTRHARFIAFLAAAARQGHIRMSEMEVMLPTRGFFARRKRVNLPPDLDIATFHLNVWMTQHGASPREAAGRSERLCEDLQAQRRETPSLVAFHCEPDELAMRIAFLAALCHRDMPAARTVSLMFERPGLQVVTEIGSAITRSVDIALNDLQAELMEHERHWLAKQHVASLRGRIETGLVTSDTIDRALEFVDPS